MKPSILVGGLWALCVLVGCGGAEQEPFEQTVSEQAVTCQQACQSEYLACMRENAGSGPGKALCAQSLTWCRAACPPALGAEATVSEKPAHLLPPCASYESFLCSGASSEVVCYHDNGQLGGCTCSEELIWSCY
ncbi:MULTISPECIES: hypothetical protein [Myxococcus]|uniref:Lipoprotein n=1 Tax=Myxococcus llanfairpwllgwyngyllgogerychwyrndrobwllllantysiliogogogochensis TaxID=2590453 RepID=A0A540WWL6_9BACT|nr:MULTISPECIES: hypothetical protein [Myxococcus]NTX04181.1 hypothetical protein [Myxococcus sp. CA040A]TQF13399.1 hypothetical protein FJV41_24045 [Myxococcus llanfairpwllgwyngyllgogerychwyrndrobwllllantysiliogogogochensis]